VRDPIPLRIATRDDLIAIVAMLADDPLGAQRERFETPLPDAYHRAFDAIERDENNALWVAVDGARVVGVMQLTIIPSLTYQGRPRALIEGVRVAADMRSAGIGRQMFEGAIERARAAGCTMVQLTTDKARPDALRFYETLGFRPSHHGMKLSLSS